MKDIFDLKKFLVENKLTANSRLLNEIREIEAAAIFFKNKNIELETVEDGNEGEKQAGSLKDGKALIWDAKGKAQYDGKDYFGIWISWNKELLEEIKSEFPVLSVGGSTGRYYYIQIENK